jgi:rhodanese-related sulfurtransferase
MILLLNACQFAAPNIGREISVDGGSYRVVSVQELQEMLENKDFTLINVHIPWQGDIPKTDLQLPYDQINENLSSLPSDKDDKIMIYCLTSGMAKIAAQSLLELGYTNLWMLEGGTTAWDEAGMTLNKE